MEGKLWDAPAVYTAGADAVSAWWATSERRMPGHKFHRESPYLMVNR
jgi:hypothetical protein